MNKEYEIIDHPFFKNFKLFLVNMNYRTPHIHGDFEICLVLDGTVNITSQNSTITIKKNDFVVFNPGQIHELKSESYALILSLQVVQTFCNNYFPLIRNIKFSFCSMQSCIPEDINTVFCATLIKLAHHYYKQEIGYEFRCLSLLNLLYYQLIRHAPYVLISEDEKSHLKSNRMIRIIEYINENFQQKLLLSEIAQSENLTVSYLSHFFKQYFHKSFQDYVMCLRCEKARLLLMNTDNNLIDICYESGFSDMKYMNQSFIKQYGCPPKKFRNLKSIDEDFPKSMEMSTRQEFFSKKSSLEMLDKYYSTAKPVFALYQLNDLL